MPKLRFVLGFLTAVSVGVAAYASAASLGGLNSGSLGAGSATVSSCDTDGFAVEYTLSAAKVTTATVGGINSNCGGGNMTLTLTGAGSAALGDGTGTVPAGGGSLAITIASQPDAELVSGVHVAVISQ